MDSYLEHYGTVVPMSRGNHDSFSFVLGSRRVQARGLASVSVERSTSDDVCVVGGERAPERPTRSFISSMYYVCIAWNAERNSAITGHSLYITNAYTLHRLYGAFGPLT